MGELLAVQEVARILRWTTQRYGVGLKADCWKLWSYLPLGDGKSTELSVKHWII